MRHEIGKGRFKQVSALAPPRAAADNATDHETRDGARWLDDNA